MALGSHSAKLVKSRSMAELFGESPTRNAGPYLIKTPSGRGIRATGIAWIDQTTAAVLQTQLDLSVAEARQMLRTRITVVYRHDETLGFHVPVEMRESHEQSDPSSRFGGAVQLGGRARYLKFRRFRAEAQEGLVPPP